MTDGVAPQQQDRPGIAKPPVTTARPARPTGLVGLIMVVTTMIITLALFFSSVVPMVLLIGVYGFPFSADDPPPDGAGATTALAAGYVLACLLGIVGWVLSILGTVRDQARAAGIAGIVVGAVAALTQLIAWLSSLQLIVGALG